MAMAKIMAYLGLDRTNFDRGLAGARAQASRFAQGFGKAFGGMGSIFKAGLFAAFGLAVGRAAKSVGELAREARRTGDFSIIDERTVKNIEAASWHVENLKNSVQRLIASGANGLGRLFGFGNAADEGATLARETVAADATAEIIRQRSEIKLAQMADEDRVKVLTDQVAVLRERASVADTELARQELLLQADQKAVEIAKANERINKERLRTQKDLADEAERAAEAAEKQRQAFEKAQAEADQESFDKRQPLVERLRAAATDPAKRRQMGKELREQEKEQRKLQQITERAEWKRRMSEMPGNENRRRFRLTKREAMALEADRLNQQDSAMAESLKNVDTNTKDMLKVLQENLALK